jgi:hypothetical protein
LAPALVTPPLAPALVNARLMQKISSHPLFSLP